MIKEEMLKDEIITLSRDCPAILIPAGEKVTLIKGAKVRITQSLGGDYTLSVNGSLVKISGNDADAIGKKGVEQDIIGKEKMGDGTVDENLVWEAMRTCYDPEIPVNVVDLGLIYNLDIQKDNDGLNNIVVDMTLTAPGCGMGPFIARDVETKVAAVPNVDHVMVKLVWEPMWNKDMMSENAQLQLGML